MKVIISGVKFCIEVKMANFVSGYGADLLLSQNDWAMTISFFHEHIDCISKNYQSAKLVMLKNTKIIKKIVEK